MVTSWSMLSALLIAITTALVLVFFFKAEDGIRDIGVTGVQTCALPISQHRCLRPGRVCDQWRAVLDRCAVRHDAAMRTSAQRRLVALAACGLLVVIGLGAGAEVFKRHGEPRSRIDDGARDYIRLVSQLGARDPDTLDVEGTAGPI